MLQKIFLILVWEFAFTPYSNCQYYFNNNPYNLHGLNMESYGNDIINFSKEEIIKNKVKSVSVKTYLKNKRGDSVGVSNDNELGIYPNYSISFDRSGNPINYYSVFHTSKGRKSLFDAQKYFYHCQLSYNNGRLEQIKELNEGRATSSDWEENDIYFFYDSLKRVIKEEYSRKHIYLPGFTYKGITYSNDTAIVYSNFHYKDSILEYVAISGRYYSTNAEPLDKTISVNGKFENLFDFKKDQKGLTYDSLGNLKQRILYKCPSNVRISGKCSCEEVPASILRFYFNKEHKLIKTEIYDLSNKMMGTVFECKHFSNGMIELQQDYSSGIITIYKYLFY